MCGILFAQALAPVLPRITEDSEQAVGFLRGMLWMRFTKNQLAVGPYCAMDHIMIAILLMGDFLQMQLTVYIYIYTEH